MNQVIRSPQELRGNLIAPGDRSITVRAILLASLAQGTSQVKAYLDSDDTRACIACMHQLGVDIQIQTNQQQPAGLIITGRGLHGLIGTPEQPLYCDSSGATMRLLAGLMSGQHVASTLDGSNQLRKRPMRRVTQPLRLMGAKIFDQEGCAPLQIEPAPIIGLDYSMSVVSAQVKSALLLAGLYAQDTLILRESVQTRDHTERMMQAAGVDLSVVDGTQITLHPPKHDLRPLDMVVPADFSSAAFFVVVGLLHPNAQLVLPNVGVNPTRTGLLDALAMMGATVKQTNPRIESGEPVADLDVSSSRLQGVEIAGELTSRMIDEFPVFAVAATQAQGKTVVKDAEELRVKESNRLEGLVTELRKMGADIQATADGFVIQGPTQLQGCVVETYDDHRMAMALAVAGLIAQGETTLLEAECVAKTYPEFFSQLAEVVYA